MANNPNLIENCPSIPWSKPIQERNMNEDMQYEYIKKLLTSSWSRSVWVFLPNKNLVDKFSQKLFSENVPHTPYHSKIEINSLSNRIITTYLCSKWLEFDIVILCVSKDISEQTNIKNRLFVLSTRAKENIYILFEN